MSSDLENAIRAVSMGNPSQVADANAFLLAFVESDDAWQPALDLVETATDDFISSFASNFLYTKIRKHWSSLNPDQRHAVFNVLSTKLNALAMHPGVANKLVVNRVSLALLCVCSRIPNGISAFATQAFLFFRAPEFQNRAPGPQLVALEMLNVVPTEVHSTRITISLYSPNVAGFFSGGPAGCCTGRAARTGGGVAGAVT